LAEASHSKKTVKKAGNGEAPDSCSLVMGIFPGESEATLTVAVHSC
jgi:hypothetical protein